MYYSSQTGNWNSRDPHGNLSARQPNPRMQQGEHPSMGLYRQNVPGAHVSPPSQMQRPQTPYYQSRTPGYNNIPTPNMSCNQMSSQHQAPVGNSNMYASKVPTNYPYNHPMRQQYFRPTGPSNDPSMLNTGARYFAPRHEQARMPRGNPTYPTTSRPSLSVQNPAGMSANHIQNQAYQQRTTSMPPTHHSYMTAKVTPNVPAMYNGVQSGNMQGGNMNYQRHPLYSTVQRNEAQYMMRQSQMTPEKNIPVPNIPDMQRHTTPGRTDMSYHQQANMVNSNQFMKPTATNNAPSSNCRPMPQSMSPAHRKVSQEMHVRMPQPQGQSQPQTSHNLPCNEVIPTQGPGLFGDLVVPNQPEERNFNIDSLLDKSFETSGSFLQQLEDIIPSDSVSDSSNSASNASNTNVQQQQPAPGSNVQSQDFQKTTPENYNMAFSRSPTTPAFDGSPMLRSPNKNTNTPAPVGSINFTPGINSSPVKNRVSEPVPSMALKVPSMQQNVPSMPQNVQPMPQNVPPMPQNVTSMPQNVSSMLQNVPSMPHNVQPMSQNVQSLPHNVSSMSQNVSSMSQNASSMSQNVLPIPQNVLPMPQNVPPMLQNVQSMPQNVPSMPQTLPSMQQNVLSMQQNVPSMQQNMPSMSQNVPSMSQNVPSMQQNMPSMLQSVPVMPQGILSRPPNDLNNSYTAAERIPPSIYLGNRPAGFEASSPNYRFQNQHMQRPMNRMPFSPRCYQPDYNYPRQMVANPQRFQQRPPMHHQPGDMRNFMGRGLPSHPYPPHGPMGPNMSGSGPVHSSVPVPNPSMEPRKPGEKSGKKPKSKKNAAKSDAMSPMKKKKATDINAIPTDGMGPDSIPYAQGCIEDPTATNAMEISNVMDTAPKNKTKKKPPATFKAKKRKLKRGNDSDDYDQIFPSSVNSENSEMSMRRSSRNSKRKRYVETWDPILSDEEGLQAMPSLKEERATIREGEEEVEEKLVVEKILDMRLRKVPLVVENKTEKSEEKETTEVEVEASTISDEIPAEKSDPIPPENVEEENGMEVSTEEEPAKTPEKTETEEITASKEKDTEDATGSNTVQSPEKLPEINGIRKISSQDGEKEKEPSVEPEQFTEVEEYYVKYKNYSYLHCEWRTREELKDKRVDAKIKRFKSKAPSMLLSEMEMGEPFNPAFVEVERVLDVSTTEEVDEKVTKHYLVKWRSLPYEDSTWEEESEIPAQKILEFEERCRYRPPEIAISLPNKAKWRKLSSENGIFKNSNELRDYQLEGLNWLLFNLYNRRNCILADEMGLGKTIQSITFLQKMFDSGVEGPFLVVAPLSTIGNWQREFVAWTSLNAFVYHGSQTSRDMIKTYEFMCRDENLDEIPGAYKMHAVITTYEMIVLENSDLLDIEWKCLIIDEAHRLKNQACKLADCLRSMQLNFKVLLTGTPLQNNVEELFALLNFLQPEVFNSSEAFSAEFGTLTDNSQVEKLQALLKPMMLRRLKEDVEKSLAPKEETIIEVELTNIQKKYYRAILERNFEFLSKGTTAGNVPNLMNTMMELRKCCNHPYLIKGAEDKIRSEDEQSMSDFSMLDLMIQSSGKLVLLDKLLPRLKSGGHKVLIFSQMVRVLDILEDYLNQKQYLHERIDGCVRGNDRQSAIDRFSKPEADRFVFLLCTRAGGLGINLTAADTVIIFDSDWNPQNDLQAQARCHRIGQKKTVKIYRLITRNSYEREMFDKASLKLGLDKAVLQSISGRKDQPNQANSPALSKQEVEDLLKRGAYGAIMDEDEDSKKFCEENIDQILQRRAHTITIAAGEKGSTFSKASFVSGEERTDISLDDPDFWEKWAKKADLDVERMTGKSKLIMEEPRRRKQTKRFGGAQQNEEEVYADIGSDSDSDYQEKEVSKRQKNKSKMKNWSKKDYFRILKSLLTFGWGRWIYMLSRRSFPSYIKCAELEQVCRALLIQSLKFYNGDEKIKVFIWDLITPATHSTNSALLNHEGLSASVPRGRKARRAKEEADSMRKQQVETEREWLKEINVETTLQDEGFRKHIQQHCNKIVLRVRMLYYLHTEILGAAEDTSDELEFEKFVFKFPDMMPDNLLPSWDEECDKHLLFGVYKHGYEKYNLVRADPKLCFMKKFGMPDNKALADDMDFEAEDDNKDPEYKPKVNFNEYSEFEDSPVPGTAPASPISADSPSVNKPLPATTEEKPTSIETNLDDTMKLDEDKPDETNDQKVVKKEPPNVQSKPDSWPTVSEINLRIRRIIACYRKHKQMQTRMINLDMETKLKLKELTKEKREYQSHWTRREEADFYRTVSTFGVKYNEKGQLVWKHFRSIAKLDRKSDENLEIYFIAFKAMCEKVCRNTKPDKEAFPEVSVAVITEERASRTLHRLQVLDCIRLEVLRHEKLEERLKLCEHSPDLPLWWKQGKHDKELLIGMDRHGVTRTEIHILNDNSLSFQRTLYEYEMKEQNQRSARKRKNDRRLLMNSMILNNESDIRSKHENLMSLFGGKGNDEEKEKADASDVKKEEEMTPENFEKQLKKKLDEILRSADSDDRKKESLQNMVLEMDTPYTAGYVNSSKWPKDRVLIQHVEDVCYCIKHNKWPVHRLQDNSLSSFKTYSTQSSSTTHSSSNTKTYSQSNPSNASFPEGLSPKDASFLMSSYSQLQAFNLKKPSPKQVQSAYEALSKKSHIKEAGKSGEESLKSTKQKDVLDLHLLNSQFAAETLQSLLKKDLSSPANLTTRRSSPQQPILGSPFKPKTEDIKPKMNASSPRASIKKEQSANNVMKKKKTLKSKIGFISPAVLPSDAHIPVHNPSRKEKLTGDDAPLNRDLADWLKQHPGFVVDYKSLRQKLDEEGGMGACEKNEKKEAASSSVFMEKEKSRGVSPSSSKKSQSSNPVVDTKPIHSQPPFPKELAQAWGNLPMGLMESLYGVTPEMAALLAGGMLPGMMPLNESRHSPAPQSSSKHKRKQPQSSDPNYETKKHHESRSSESKYQESSSKSEKLKQEQEAALLSQALLGYLPKSGGFMMNDPYQLMNMFQHSMMQYDKQNLAAASGLSPFFPGLPFAPNPLFPGLYPQPDLTSSTSNALAKEYLKMTEQEAAAKLLNPFGTTNPDFSSPVLDFNNPELQKLWLSEQLLQAQMQTAMQQSASSKSSRQANDDMQAMYQQLYSSLMPNKNVEPPVKEEKRNKPDVEPKSPAREEAMNLTSIKKG